MFKKFLVALFLCSFAAVAQATPEVKEMLRTADNFRLAEKSARVETTAARYKDDKLEETKRYHVYVKPGRRSLVLFKTPSELGQKMLMLDDQFWLILPTSKRPIRITATQKLLGEASAGDIATMNWSEDYDGKRVGDDKVGDVAAVKLDLQATRAGTTYDRIVLWLARESFRPLQAELYLTSGKLAKVARYEMGTLDGRAAVVKTYLQDHIQTNRRTILEVQAISAAENPDKIYNPAYLLRENLESW
jgi:hypothetical protein